MATLRCEKVPKADNIKTHCIEVVGSKKVEMLAVEMETLCDEFMRRLYREEKK